jgi:hypothetical protein
MTGFRFDPHFIAAAAIFFAAAANCVHADLVVVQKVEGGAQAGDMTMKIKDDRARADISPAVSTIIDITTGDVAILMHAQKTFTRINAAAARELLAKVKKNEHENNGNQPTRPKLQQTGKKEKLLGYDAEEFIWEFGEVKLTYWIAKDFPNATAILTVMKKMQTGAALLASGFMPDPMELPGLPLKTELTVSGKKSFTTTLVSVKEEPVDETEFDMPDDYKEVLPTPLHQP